MTELKKYEVTLSVRMHGAFTVFARDEREAETIVGTMFERDEIRIADLEVADDTQIDCAGEAETDARAVNDPEAETEAEEPPKHICPLSQQSCDENCSWSEMANCEYHEGLVAGRAGQ